MLALSEKCRRSASRRRVSPRLSVRKQNHLRVRTCVIFNPAARGNKARHFRRWLDGVSTQCTLKPTAGPSDARRLAAQAVAENFELIVAAGGDGTVNEVLNLSLIHISEPTRRTPISYAVFCLKKKNNKH